MKKLFDFIKAIGGSMVWLLLVLALLMISLRWLAKSNVPVVSTAAGDAQNLVKAGSISGN